MTVVRPQLQGKPFAVDGAADPWVEVPRVSVEDDASWRLRLRIGGLVALGYLYLGALLLLLVGGGIALLAVHVWVFGLGLIGLAISLGRMLRLEESAPSGMPVEDLEAPRFVEWFERIRQQVGGRASQVLLGFDDSASVAEVSRRGKLGRNRVHVTIGLPLLLALPVDQAEAVVAQELAHASRRHGRWSLWVWNGLERWHRIAATLERQEHWARRLVRRFFAFYAPRLERNGLMFKRAHEHEADRIAAELVGTATLASALARSRLAASLVDEIWSEICHRATSSRDFPDAFESLAAELHDRTIPDAEMAFRYMLGYDRASTHPTVAQRLTALGVTDISLRAVAMPPTESAAQALLERLSE